MTEEATPLPVVTSLSSELTPLPDGTTLVESVDKTVDPNFKYPGHTTLQPKVIIYETPSAKVTKEYSAKVVAAPPPKVLKLGTALSTQGAVQNAYGPQYLQLFTQYFDTFTPEWEGKMQACWTGPSTYNFGALESLVQAAKKPFRMHNLIWGIFLPSWLTNGSWSQSQLTSMVLNYIEAAAGTAKSLGADCIDVLNEVVDDGGNGFKTSNSYWATQFQGQALLNFYAQCFAHAAAAAPGLPLFINEYCNAGEPGNAAKLNGTHGVVQQLLAAGAPISGVGMQSHDRTDFWPVAASLAAAVTAYKELVDHVEITELDIQVMAGSSLSTQTQAMGDIVSGALQSDLDRISVWEFDDAASWLGSGAEADEFTGSYAAHPDWQILYSARGK